MARIKQFADDLGISYNEAKKLIEMGRNTKDAGSSAMDKARSRMNKRVQEMKKNQKKAVAALIVMEYPSMNVLYEDFEQDTTDYPYIPGFLAFKEVPSYKVLFDRLRK